MLSPSSRKTGHTYGLRRLSEPELSLQYIPRDDQVQRVQRNQAPIFGNQIQSDYPHTGYQNYNHDAEEEGDVYYTYGNNQGNNNVNPQEQLVLDDQAQQGYPNGSRYNLRRTSTRSSGAEASHDSPYRSSRTMYTAEERRQHRRERNRLYAKECRARKSQKIGGMSEQLDNAKAEIEQLKDELAKWKELGQNFVDARKRRSIK